MTIRRATVTELYPTSENVTLLPTQALFQIGHGLAAELPAALPIGELFYTTDTHALYIGTGTGTMVIGGGGTGPAGPPGPAGPTGPTGATGATGATGPAVTVPMTNRIVVDNKRVDSYIEDGSITTPYKTIAAGVAAIVAAGDNTINNPYSITLATSQYDEPIDLSNPALKCLYIFGNGSNIGTAASTYSALKIVNNDNLSDCYIFHCVFRGNGTHLVELGSSTNGSTFLNATLTGVGLALYDCIFSPTGNGDFYVNCAGAITCDRCSLMCGANLTNVVQMFVREGSGLSQGPTWNLNSGGTPAPVGFSISSLIFRYTNSQAIINVNNNSALTIHMGARQRSAVNLNNSGGLFNNIGGLMTSTITVVAGATYSESFGGFHSGSLVNSGTYQVGGSLGIGQIFLGVAGNVGPKVSAGAGAPNGVVTGSPGDLYLATGGGAATTLWIKETGSNTNTGWVGK